MEANGYRLGKDTRTVRVNGLSHCCFINEKTCIPCPVPATHRIIGPKGYEDYTEVCRDHIQDLKCEDETVEVIHGG